MNPLKALRGRTPGTERGTEAESYSRNHDEPISGYNRLDDKEVGDRLSQLSQVELAAVEAYERAHGNRSAVLDKLRYMRGTEPVPGYDALTTEQISEVLADADAETVKAVRLRAQVPGSPVRAGRGGARVADLAGQRSRGARPQRESRSPPRGVRGPRANRARSA
jgi:hypothetical protein